MSDRPASGGGAPKVYRFPRIGLTVWAIDWLLGRRRSFVGDSRWTLRDVRPQPKLNGPGGIC